VQEVDQVLMRSILEEWEAKMVRSKNDFIF